MSCEKVGYPSEHPDGEAMGFMVGVPKEGSKGVVVIHEWWGVDAYVMETSERIRDAGFVVLAADIFRGKVFTEPKEARANMMEFNFQKAALDVNAAAKYLKSRGCAKVAVVGYGFGGALALVAAAHAADGAIDAASPHCGVPKPEIEDLSKIRCPVQGHYAVNDRVIGVSSPIDYNGMAEKLWSNSVPLEMCLYDADHAFVNPNYPMYDEEKTEEYYNNLFTFLTEKLENP